jgi:hypothetical protein
MLKDKIKKSQEKDKKIAIKEWGIKLDKKIKWSKMMRDKIEK